jgi:hypothetical protein
MSHSIQVFIARKEILESIALTLNQARLIFLPMGFAMIPNTEELFDSITNNQQARANKEFEVFYKLSSALISWAEDLSKVGPVAYIETDYFGGTGSQSAVAWLKGKVICGPSESEAKWLNGQLVDEPLEQTAINKALKCLGVERGEALDEFDAIGLGNYRDNEKWIEQAYPK